MSDHIPAREKTPFGQFQLRPSHLTTSKPGAKFQGRMRRIELPPALAPEPAPLPAREQVDDEPPRFGPFISGDWIDDALRAQTDPEAFFPDKGGATRPAKLVCAACPVRQECLDWAIENGERFGIWGGLSERERRALRKDAA